MANPIALIKRPTYMVAALLIGAATLVPVVFSTTGHAVQLENRSIQLSNSATGGTSVQYTTSFRVKQATLIRGIVIDICSGNTSPLIGVACSQPTSFSWQASPTVVSATIGATNIASWTWSTLNTNRTLVATNATGVTPAINDVVTIVISGVANPSDVDVVTAGNQVGTFYGRMITTNTTAAATGYLATQGESTTGFLDVGGAAMSTINNLTVTARVQEHIRFCVYTNGFETSGTERTCIDGTGSAIDIPDATTPLSSNAVLSEDAYFNLSTNALNGVNVRMWSNNGYDGVLASGTNTITAFGGTVDDACTADSTNTATEQFGLRIVGGNVTAVAPYNCGANNHGWDADNAAGAGANDATTVGSTYGDTIATTSGAVDVDETRLEFAAKSALTTQAGIYSTVLNYIATGTY